MKSTEKPLLFISHAGEDSSQAKELARRLRRIGLRPWLDLDELRPGDRWMEALEEALRKADAFTIYVGRSGVQRWMDSELRVALNRNVQDPSFRIIPLLGPGAEPKSLPSFLSQHQWLDLREGMSPTKLKKLIGAVLKKTPEAVSLLQAGEPPFRGLDYFDIEHETVGNTFCIEFTPDGALVDFESALCVGQL